MGGTTEAAHTGDLVVQRSAAGGPGVSVQGTPSRGGEEARVRAVEDLGILDTGPEERFDRITRLARRLFGVSAAAVTLVDRDRQYVKSNEGTPLTGGPRGEAFCDHTVRQPEALVVEDATADPRFAANPLVTGEPRIRFYAGHPLEAAGGHRVGALCLVDERPRTFGEPERALLGELAAWVQSELTRSAEMEHAAQVQRRLLPRRSPDVPGYDVAGICMPSRGVGGDLLDWYPADDGDLVVTLADVMGKGLGAAIIMATVRAALRSAGRSAEPAEAVTTAARTLQEDLEETSTLVTLVHCRLAPADGRLRFTDAGHGLLLLVRADGSVQRPSSGGLPLGVLPEERWGQTEVRLEPGDVAVVFSDGLLDLYDGTLAGISEVARTVRAAGGAAAVVAELRELARRSGLLDDDVTVAVVRRLP